MDMQAGLMFNHPSNACKACFVENTCQSSGGVAYPCTNVTQWLIKNSEICSVFLNDSNGH